MKTWIDALNFWIFAAVLGACIGALLVLEGII